MTPPPNNPKPSLSDNTKLSPPDIQWWACPDKPEPVRVEVLKENPVTLDIRYRLLGQLIERRLSKTEHFICPNWENTRMVLVIRAEALAEAHERKATKAREVEAKLRALTPPKEALEWEARHNAELERIGIANGNNARS